MINESAILSGMLVGIGVIANIQCENRYIGALLFSVALLAIIKENLQLYTSKIGFATKKMYSVMEYFYMLMYNLLGASFSVLIMGCIDETIYVKLKSLALVKFDSGWTYLLCCGFFCGILISVASYCKDTVITILCIMAFILSGYEHCIADFPLFITNLSLENFIKFLAIVIGNTGGAIIAYTAIPTKN